MHKSSVFSKIKFKYFRLPFLHAKKVKLFAKCQKKGFVVDHRLLIG